METKNALFISAIKSGLIIGVVSIVVFVIMYVAGILPIGIFKPLMILLLSIILTIIIIIILFKKYRTEIGGYISFRNAFLYFFIALTLSIILDQFFRYIFLQILDPEYYKTLGDAQYTWWENYLTGKVPDDQLSEQLDKINEQSAKMGTFATLIKGLLGSILFGGIIALVMGAIMKKNPDVFDNASGGVI